MVVKKAGANPNVGQIVEGEAQQVKPENKVKKPKAVQPKVRQISIDEIRKMGGGEPQKKKTPRYRFAPSPTGNLHIGGAYIAALNWLAVKQLKEKGIEAEFVLRIEDTDQIRSKPEFTEAILEGVKWVGMDWDGELVFQSHRTDLYQQKVDQLVDGGKAYRDDNNAVWFRMPKEGTLTVNDRVKGNINIPIPQDAEGKTDFIIQRSDGSPMFLLANAVDDGDQGITHVIRGEDHLNNGNVVRQIELFRALGYDEPEWYHLPLVLGDPKTDPEDKDKIIGGGKLSKRDGATSVMDYELMGFDPTVLVNHLVRLGMNFDTEETLSMEELAKRFDPLSFSKTGSPINQMRLMTRQKHSLSRSDTNSVVKQIKERLADKAGLLEFFKKSKSPYVTPKKEDKEHRDSFFERTGVLPKEAEAMLVQIDDNMIEAAVDGAKSRASILGEIIDLMVFFRAPPAYSEQSQKLFNTPKMQKMIGELVKALEDLPAEKWNLDELNKAMEGFNKEKNLGGYPYGKAMRWMLTGLPDGLPLHNSLAILGREEAIKRINDCLAAE